MKKKKPKYTKAQQELARRYRLAWDYVVDNLSDYQKNIIINNYPYDNRVDKDVSDEVSHEVAKLAESNRKIKAVSKIGEHLEVSGKFY